MPKHMQRRLPELPDDTYYVVTRDATTFTATVTAYSPSGAVLATVTITDEVLVLLERSAPAGAVEVRPGPPPE